MCTVLLRLSPSAEWPVQLAFVRDEDRARPSDPPDRWWSTQPHVVGGRDGRAGGTWLAVDSAAPAAALLTDQFDPGARVPDPATSPTRGTLPLLVLDRGSHFDLEADAPGGVDHYQPFHLVSIVRDGEEWVVERWGWSGTALEHELLAPGDHVVASRALTLPGEPERRRRLLAQLAEVPVDSDWTRWKALLDARATAPDQLDGIAVHSVSQRPGFGTVGASLVAIAHDARIRYAANRSTTLDPARWQRILP